MMDICGIARGYLCLAREYGHNPYSESDHHDDRSCHTHGTGDVCAFP